MKNVINQRKVGFVGLVKTKVKAHNMGKLYLSLFQGWCFTSNSSFHKGGRIVIAWNPKSFHVNIVACSSLMIHCEIRPLNGLSFACYIIYASNDVVVRELAWQDLENLAVIFRSHGLLLGIITVFSILMKE